MSILLDVGIGLEINVLTSKFILLGYQMLGEMGCHPEICFYVIVFYIFNCQNLQGDHLGRSLKLSLVKPSKLYISV